ncbi:sodium:proton exchanger [Actibacterium mucosum KCTC 23349]|uniref:Sodium:proton exchanger n=1 Tax=Actibacterium mucosum KCTC 23349 TaxID=1454373 RepID=A0A037ZD34_9RHOB|nr:calcium/sodium antiporter [Actibacterium mucosum]KAJ54062.1 sodium:proton exchanger [Actibacterium mucosum KCTC 23349]
MLTDLFFALLGLVILLLAGDSLVRGAVNLSLRLGVPALIVSLTIVAFGTSAPELLIAVSAVLEQAPGIALGNVVGSNTANVLLVLGVPALISGLDTETCDTRRTYLMMLAATVLFIAMCLTGMLVWWHGIILLIVLSLVLGDAFMAARAHQRAGIEEDDEDIEGADAEMEGWKIAVYMVLGLIGLPMGAEFLVDSSVNIARSIGVSETVIGLTLVAVGTSLPELATTVMAAIRRQSDVALGNVIGSNMFNLLAIMGVATLVGPIPVPPGMMMMDLWVMLAASLVLVPFVFKGWPMRRGWGTILTTLYVTYVFVVLFTGA